MHSPTPQPSMSLPPQAQEILSSSQLRGFTQAQLKKFQLTSVYEPYDLMMDAALKCYHQVQCNRPVLKPIPWAKTVIYRRILHERDQLFLAYDPQLLQDKGEAQQLAICPPEEDLAEKRDLLALALAALYRKDRKGWCLLRLRYEKSQPWNEIAQSLQPCAVQREGLDKVSARLRKRKERALKDLRQIFFNSQGLCLIPLVWSGWRTLLAHHHHLL